jgi:hypothetical protein
MLRKFITLLLCGLSLSVDAHISRILLHQWDGSCVYRNVYDPQEQFKDAGDRRFDIRGFVASEEVHDYVISLQKRFSELPQIPLVIRTAHFEHELTELPFLYYYSHWKRVQHDHGCFFANLYWSSSYRCRFAEYVHKDDLNPWGTESVFPMKPKLELLFLDIAIQDTLDESEKRYLGHQLGHMIYNKNSTYEQLKENDWRRRLLKKSLIVVAESVSWMICICAGAALLHKVSTGNVWGGLLKFGPLVMGTFFSGLYLSTTECDRVCPEEALYCDQFAQKSMS